MLEKVHGTVQSTDATLDMDRSSSLADRPDTRPRWRVFLSGWQLWTSVLGGLLLGVLVVALGRRGLVNLLSALTVGLGFLYVVGATIFMRFVVPMSGSRADTPDGRESRLDDLLVLLSIPVVSVIVLGVFLWRVQAP
jgi:hypothetical protein